MKILNNAVKSSLKMLSLGTRFKHKAGGNQYIVIEHMPCERRSCQYPCPTEHIIIVCRAQNSDTVTLCSSLAPENIILD